MELTITEKAMKEILTLSKKEQPALLLWYDTDQCGCGVNGIPTVYQVTERKDSYVEVDCNAMKVYIEGQQRVFFSERMTLDLSNGMFRLSSPQQIINPFIPSSNILKDARGT